MISRAKGLYAILIGANLLAWGLALAAFGRGHSLLLGPALLAYTFGLRHAVDADHISAIDNVTRKLMQEGKRPVGVGFFFSLGHSTIVFVLTIAIVVAASAVKARLPLLEAVGGNVGTLISSIFLLLIAAVNLLILGDVIRAFSRARRGQHYSESAVTASLDRRGLWARLLRPMLTMVSNSRRMYPIGLLFGLGFDTATEVGLLAIAAVEAGKGLPVWSILIFPLLFAAGMSLIDTTDGILMLGAYGWAFVHPVRKLYYNVTITLTSVLVALLVGGIEGLGVLATQLRLHGMPWNAVAALNDNFGVLGFCIIGVFLASWLLSMILYRVMRLDSPPLSPSEVS